MTWAKKTGESKTVYEIVTDKIIAKMEQGIIPWRIPWNYTNGAVSWNTQKGYRGINAMLLDPGEYATFNQITESGGKVKKGSKAHHVVFWKFFQGVDEEGNETGKKSAMMRYYTVFEINTQCEGLKSKRKIVEEKNHDPIFAAEQIKEGYKDSPLVTFAPGRAYYQPQPDTITIPSIKDYDKPEEYYSTMFHEMAHSTGHKSRLNREGVIAKAAFGSETYSKEELVAEITAAMLCGVAGIENSTIENSAAYIQSWSRKFKQDSKLIVTAAGQAQKAADYIQGIKAEY